MFPPSEFGYTITVAYSSPDGLFHAKLIEFDEGDNILFETDDTLTDNPLTIFLEQVLDKFEYRFGVFDVLLFFLTKNQQIRSWDGSISLKVSGTFFSFSYFFFRKSSRRTTNSGHCSLYHCNSLPSHYRWYNCYHCHSPQKRVH